MSIELHDLTKRYGEHIVVNRVDLEVRDGELFVLLGSSGSGKSTILRMIAGLAAPDSGQIILHGRAVTDLPPQRRGTGFVFQNYSNFRHMTAAENIEFGLRIRKVPPADRNRRSRELLELVGMAGLGSRYPDQLSGGQQQRVAIARALAYEPAVLLLDEPFGALDVKIRAQLRESLKIVQRQTRVTTILVTHDQEEAFELADRIGVVERGRLVEVGSPQGLYYHPRTEYSATFIGGGNVLVGRSEGEWIRLGNARLPFRKDDPPHEEGAPVRVLFRPETILLDPAGFAGQPGVQSLARGQVRDLIFAGPLERVRLEVDGLQGARPLAPSPIYGQRKTLIDAVLPSQPAAGGFEAGRELWIGVREYHVLEPSGLRLLISLDPTPGGEAAAAMGCMLTAAASGTATLLGVVPEHGETPKIRAEVEQFLKKWSTQTAGLQSRIRTGAAASEILAETETAPYDILVLGHSSDPKAEPGRLGSTATRILEHASIPVLVVGQVPEAIRRVLICTAGGEPGKNDVLLGGRLARHSRAGAVALHVATGESSETDLERVHRHLREAQGSLELLGITAETRIAEAESVLEGILKEAGTGAYDLIVIGAPSPKDRLLRRGPDLAIQIVRITQRPVLVVPTL
jgi:sulfate transport system ATP-binding protein